MNKQHWQGVLPAMTTPFKSDDTVDHAFLARHAAWMIENGCDGVVALGSLGEGATLRFDEKIEVLETLVSALDDEPVIAGISALSTGDAVELAQAAQRAGCQGLMVLPPYVYSTDWREMRAHVAAICGATDLSCMIYNNPIAYKTDFLANHLADLADEFDNVHAVKESSSDVRRVTAIKALLGDRMAISVGLTTLSSKASRRARPVGSPDWSTLCRANPSSFTNSRCRANATKPSSYTAGFCRCWCSIR